MPTRSRQTAAAPADLVARLERDGIEHLWVAYVDYSGRPQAKSVPNSRFAKAVADGLTFAKANLDFNHLDHMADASRYTADTGDFFAVPDPAAYAPWPLVPRTGRALAWMREEGGVEWDGCPRTMLQRQVDAYAAEGLRVEAAFEPEGYLFVQTGEHEVAPADRTAMFTLAGLETHAALLHRVSETLEAMGVAVEQVAPEYGHGQIEINIRHAPPLKAADDLITLKDVVRAVAREAGLLASFMPKPYEHLPGCGLHVHLSLWELEGERCVMEPAAGETPGEGPDEHPSGLSKRGRGFVAGLLQHAAGLCGVGAPTVNSYKRLQPGSWAPAHAAYGFGNRSAFVRIPGGSRRRVEVRSGDNLANPYLYLTALLAAGLDGIRRGDDPGLPARGDLGLFSVADSLARGIALLPRNVTAALDSAESDPIIVEAIGPTIFHEWLKVRRSEVAAYELAVSPWERAAYLET
jgi:glutamine synthetase